MDFEKINQDLKNAKIAVDESGLEEDLKKIAFEKIMDKILNSEQIKRNKVVPKKRVPKRNMNNKEDDNSKINEEEVTKVVSGLSRSKHATVYKLDKTLDQALYVLKIIEDEFGLRKFSPGQISKVLKEVFRILKSPESISMALLKAKTFADRDKIIVNGVVSYKYELMHGGEEYLKKKVEEITMKKNDQGPRVKKEDPSLLDESDKVESD